MKYSFYLKAVLSLEESPAHNRQGWLQGLLGVNQARRLGDEKGFEGGDHF